MKRLAGLKNLACASCMLGSLLLGSCNGGGSSSNSVSDNGSVGGGGNAAAQTVTIDASKAEQYASPNVLTGGSGSSLSASGFKASTKLAANPNSCLAVPGNKLSFDSSSSVWYMSGSFTITNSCTSAQQLAGTQVVLTGGKPADTWNGGSFSINSFTPWLGTAPTYTSVTTGNNLQSNQRLLTFNNNYLLGSGQSIVASFGYNSNNQPLTMNGATATVLGSAPPPPPVTVANLTVNVNNAALSGVCNSTTPCNIALNLLGSTNKVYTTITTITNSATNGSYTIESIPPGNYTLAATNLPAKAAVVFVPTSLALSAGVTSTATATFSITNPGNNCLSASVGSLNSSAWWTSATLNLLNTCTTTQKLDGDSITVSSSNPADIISSFQVNGTTPYIANFASVVNNRANSPQININSNGVTLAPNGTLAINFAYSPNGVLLKGSLVAAVNGSTPVVTNSSLAVTVDTTGLANYCIPSTPCNIPVILTGQGGLYSQTLTTITTNTNKTVYNVLNLIPGSYTVSTANLPQALLATYVPAATIQLTSGESGALAVEFSVKPITTGNLNLTLRNPNTGVFNLESLPITITANDGSGSVAVNAVFGQLTNATLTANTYTLSTLGLASASQGVYYSYPQLPASIVANQTTSLGSMTANISTKLATESFIINGLNAGDSVTLQFTDNTYLFNPEVLTASIESAPLNALFHFQDNDVVTVNVILNSSYTPVVPFTITITPNQSYIINLVPQHKPTQQIVGYFETWQATGTWESATYSIATIPAYVNIMPLAFAKPDSTYVAGSYDFDAAGLGISATPAVAIGAIKIAQAKGQIVLLSVGGATYPNFGALNVAATMALVKDLGLDGVDYDYEADPGTMGGCTGYNTTSLSCPTDSQIIQNITQLRAGLDALHTTMGKKMYLTAAVWSIGAYGTTSFPTTGVYAGGAQQYGPFGSRAGMWVNPLKQVGNDFDALFLMSYDAGVYTPTGTPCPPSAAACYDPIAALKAYQALYTKPLYLGVEIPPEAWGGNVNPPAQAEADAITAANLGAAGTMIWALQVQGTADGVAVTANNYLQPICSLYNTSAPNGYCTQTIPLH